MTGSVRISRRVFATGSAAVLGGSAACAPVLAAQPATFNPGGHSEISRYGLRADSGEDQSAAFTRAVEAAHADGGVLSLPPGIYNLSSVSLPRRLVLRGVPGLTTLRFTGGGHFLVAVGAEYLRFEGLVLDGQEREIGGPSRALLHIEETGRVEAENCRFLASRERGIHCASSAGSINNCIVDGAAGRAGIFLVDSQGFLVSGNIVRNCANNEILVHRSEKGEDGTILSGNRISAIRADNGGTGEWGNGINVFRAGSVMVSGNQVSDCALSAIRSNAGNNIQIVSNQCKRSGETAIYSEFDFEGAIITANLVDDAGDGIAVANFMDGGRLAVIANNIVRNIADRVPYTEVRKSAGTGISVEADTNLTGNVVENAARIGIALGWGPYLRNVVASSNIIRKSPLGMYVSAVEGSGSAIVSSNIFSGCTQGNIIGHRWRDPVTADLAISDDGAIEHLALEGNVVN